MNMNGTDLTLAGVAALVILDKAQRGRTAELLLVSVGAATVLRRAWVTRQGSLNPKRDPARRAFVVAHAAPCLEMVDYMRIYRPEQIKDPDEWYTVYSVTPGGGGHRVTVSQTPQSPADKIRAMSGQFGDASMVLACSQELDEMIKQDARKRGMKPRDLRKQFLQRAFAYGLPSAVAKQGKARGLNPKQLAALGKIPSAVVAESRRINRSATV